MNKQSIKKHLRMLIGYTMLILCGIGFTLYAVDYIYTHDLTNDFLKMAAAFAFITIVTAALILIKK